MIEDLIGREVICRFYNFYTGVSKNLPGVIADIKDGKFMISFYICRTIINPIDITMVKDGIHIRYSGLDHDYFFGMNMSDIDLSGERLLDRVLYDRD